MKAAASRAAREMTMLTSLSLNTIDRDGSFCIECWQITGVRLDRIGVSILP